MGRRRNVGGGDLAIGLIPNSKGAMISYCHRALSVAVRWSKGGIVVWTVCTASTQRVFGRRGGGGGIWGSSFQFSRKEERTEGSGSCIEASRKSSRQSCAREASECKGTKMVYKAQTYYYYDMHRVCAAVIMMRFPNSFLSGLRMYLKSNIKSSSITDHRSRIMA